MKTKLFLALLLAAVVTWGCGSEISSQTTSPTPSVATAESSPVAQKTGAVTFSVKFPTAEATKAFIDFSTSKVIISGYSYMGGWSMSTPLELTPTNPTATVEVPAGDLCFYADAQDGNGMTFDHTMTCGEVLAGINNKANLTFLGADWEFVNASDVATPLILASASHGNVSLAGFRLGGMYGQPTGAAIDYTKPSGWSEYSLQYFSGTTTNAANFAPVRFGGSESQFLPGATASSNYQAFWGGEINLDTPANSPVREGLESGWSVGERVAFILDEVSGSNTTETITNSSGQDAKPTLQAYANSQVVGGSTITGHVLEMTFGPTPTSVVKETNANCNVFWQQNGGAYAQTAAIKAAIAGKAVKAAPGDATTLDAGTITSVYDECSADYYKPQIDGDGDGDNANDWLNYDVNHNGIYEPADGDTYVDNNNDSNFDFTYYPGTISTITETFSNVVVREFRAKAKQKGTSFTLAPATISISNAFLENRTFENTTNNRPVGWIEFKNNDGSLVNANDFNTVIFTDPYGYTTTNSFFEKRTYQIGTWNSTASSFGTLTARGHSGFFFDFGGYGLTNGVNTFTATLATGQTLTSQLTYDSSVSAPVVANSSMTYQWNSSDNSLNLSWIEPLGDFSDYRVVINKALPLPTGGYTPIFFGKVAKGTTTVSLTATDLAQIYAATGTGTGDQLAFVIQTRIYDANNIETARGFSNLVPIIPQGSGTGIIIR